MCIIRECETNAVVCTYGGLKKQAYLYPFLCLFRLRGNFDIRSEWVQQLRDSKQLIVEYVSTTNNVADLLTKVHPTVRFKQLLGMTQERQVQQTEQAKATPAMLACITLSAG